jgi:hypothetical protein
VRRTALRKDQVVGKTRLPGSPERARPAPSEGRVAMCPGSDSKRRRARSHRTTIKSRSQRRLHLPTAARQPGRRCAVSSKHAGRGPVRARRGGCSGSPSFAANGRRRPRPTAPAATSPHARAVPGSAVARYTRAAREPLALPRGRAGAWRSATHAPLLCKRQQRRADCSRPCSAGVLAEPAARRRDRHSTPHLACAQRRARPVRTAGQVDWAPPPTLICLLPTLGAARLS